MASNDLEKLINNLKFTNLDTTVHDRKEFIDKATKSILSKQIRSHADFAKFLDSTIRAHLTLCGDENDSVRMLSSDCLNQIIKTFQYQYYPYILKAYLEVIKSNAASRTLRAALIRLAYLQHNVQPVDVSREVHEIIKSFIEVARKGDEEPIQEALGVAIEKCMPFIGFYMDKDKVIQVSFTELIQALLENIKHQPPNIKRISSSALVDVFRNTRDPKSSCLQLLELLIESVEQSIEMATQPHTSCIGSFICLRLLLPYLKATSKINDELRKMTDLILSTIKTSQDITIISSALEALISIYDAWLIDFNESHNSQLLIDCTRLIVSRFLLTGQKGQYWPDSHSRVSIKALTLACLASIINLKPEILFLRLDNDATTPDTELEHQSIEDVFLLNNHADPQIQSNLATIRGTFLASCWRNHFHKTTELEERLFAESKCCNLVKKSWTELIDTIKDKTLPPLTLKACVNAINNCLPALLETDHCIHIVQPTDFYCLLQLVTIESYWLVKIELFELFTNLNYRTISYLENYHWIHTTNRVSNSYVGCIQDRVLKCLSTGLLNEDHKVRAGASSCLLKIVPKLYILHCNRDNNRQIDYNTPSDPIVALAQDLASEHFIILKHIVTSSDNKTSKLGLDDDNNMNSLKLKTLSSSIIHENENNFNYKRLELNKNMIVNLHHMVNFLNDILYENFDKKKEIASIVNSINELAKIYPIIEYPNCWDCRSNANSKCFELLNFLLSYISSTASIRRDLDAYRKFLALSQTLLLALCHQSVKTRFEEHKTTLKAAEQWASLKIDPPVFQECLEICFNHLVKLLNAFVCVIDDKFIRSNLNPSSNQQSSSLISKESIPSGSRRSSTQSLSMDQETSEQLFSMSPSHESRSRSILSSASNLLSNQLIIEIYDQLRQSYQSGRSNIDQSDEKYYQLLETCLEGIGNLMEYLSLNFITKHAESLLIYFKTTASFSSSLSIMCSRQLLKSLFGLNILCLYIHEPSDSDYRRYSTSSNQVSTKVQSSDIFETSPDRISNNQINNCDSPSSSTKFLDPNLGGVYYHLISTPSEKFSSYYATKSSQITPSSNVGLSTLNYEIKKTLRIRKCIEKRAVSLFEAKNLTPMMFELRKLLLSHITDFSPIVIDSMESFINTGFCKAQCESLQLMCYLILIKVNYKLLDKSERFIKSVYKLLDLIGDKVFNNRTQSLDQLIQNCFTFLILLSYERCQSEPITQMASIIQKFDHLRASEQDPNIYIIPALKCLVEDLFLCRNTNQLPNNTDISSVEIFEAEREMVAKSLIDLVEHPAIYDMLSILLQESRHDNSEIKSKKLSQKLTSTIYPMLCRQRIDLKNYESIEKIHTILESISPDVFKPIEFIMETLFSNQTNRKHDILDDSATFDRWLGLILLIMRILITQVNEEVFLFRLDETKMSLVSLWPFQMTFSESAANNPASADKNLPPTSTKIDIKSPDSTTAGDHSDILSSSHNLSSTSSSVSSSSQSSPIPNLNENNYMMCISSDDLMADYLLHVAQLCIAEILYRNMTHRYELLLVQQLSSYLIYLAHMFQSGLYCRLTRSAMNLIQRAQPLNEDSLINLLSDARNLNRGFCLAKCSALFGRINSIYPDLTIQWCNILMLVNCVDCNDAFWQRLLSYECSNCCSALVDVADQSEELEKDTTIEEEEDSLLNDDFVFKRTYISKPSSLGLAKTTFDGQLRKSFIKKITSNMTPVTSNSHQTFINDYCQASQRLAPNMELSRRGTLCLVLDFVSVNMNDVEHITWIIINYINDLISWSHELPISDFIKAIHRNSASSGLFIQAINARCNDLNSFVFIHKMLESLSDVHHTQYGSLVILLVEKLLTSPQLLPYLTLSSDIELRACETISKLLKETNRNLITTSEEVANQMTLVDVDRLLGLLDDKRCHSLSMHLAKLKDYITNQSEQVLIDVIGDDLIHQQNLKNEEDSPQQVPSITLQLLNGSKQSINDSESLESFDQSRFVDHFNHYLSQQCSDRRAIQLIQKLQREDVTNILQRPTLDLEKLASCIIIGSNSLLAKLNTSSVDFDQDQPMTWPLLEVSISALFDEIDSVLDIIEKSCPAQLQEQIKIHHDCYFLPESELCPEEMYYLKWKSKILSDQKLCLVERLIHLSSPFQSLVTHYLPLIAQLNYIQKLQLPTLDDKLLSKVTQIFRLYAELVNWMSSDQARYSYILHLVPSLNSMKVCLSSRYIMDYAKKDVSLLCTLISSVHTLCKCYLTHNVECDKPAQWSSENANSEDKWEKRQIDHVRRACINGVELIDFQEQLENIHKSLNNDCKLNTPMIYDVLRPLLVLVCRITLINSFLLVPPVLWKRCTWPMKTDKSDEDKFKVNMPMITSDLLQEIDVLDKFSYRLSTIGWTNRIQFEEIWMSLLGVFAHSLDQQTQATSPSDLDDKERLKLACLTIKTITRLLLTAKLSRPGDPTSTLANNCDTNAVFKILDISRGINKKLHDIRQQTRATLEALNGMSDSNNNNCDLGKYFTISSQQLRISLSKAEDSGNSSNSPSSSQLLPHDNIDFRSCIHLLLDVYWQKLNNKPAPLVTEICKSLISLMDFFTDFAQFKRLHETFNVLFHQAIVNKDDYQMQYLIVGICKSAAVCQLLVDPEGNNLAHFEKFRKCLDFCLRSEFMPTRVKALNGIRYILCDNGVKTSVTGQLGQIKQIQLINMLKPIILDYITKNFFSDDGNTTMMVHHIEEDYLTSMWMLALMLCEYSPNDLRDLSTTNNQLKNQQRFHIFRQKIIQRSIGALMSETVPKKLFNSVAEHLEILMLLGKLVPTEDDNIVKCAMERLKSSQIRLTSLVCLNLLLSSLYKRSQSIDQHQSEGVVDDEKLVLVMERISIISNLISSTLKSLAISPFCSCPGHADNLI